jgi:hypothetical protein
MIVITVIYYWLHSTVTNGPIILHILHFTNVGVRIEEGSDSRDKSISVHIQYCWQCSMKFITYFFHLFYLGYYCIILDFCTFIPNSHCNNDIEASDVNQLDSIYVLNDQNKYVWPWSESTVHAIPLVFA